MTAPREALYYVHINGKVSGPYTLGQLRSMWQSGTVMADTIFWCEGNSDWQSLLSMRHLLEPPSLPAPPTPQRTLQPAKPVAYQAATPKQQDKGVLVFAIIFGIIFAIICLSVG